MATLSILGSVQLDGCPLPDERPTQLLVLLALAPGGRPRAQLAARLWPGLAPEAALRNLRKTLHRLRADGHGAWLEAQGERLQLAADCTTDWQAAERAAAQGQPEAVLRWMRGPLADGLAEGAGWLEPAREAALALWRRALLAALPGLDPARAEAELERLRAIDPHDEPLARAHLRLLAECGRAEAFARVRAAYAQRLAEDLGVAPSAGLDGVAAPARAALPLPPAAERAAQAPLIGRDDTLDALLAELQPPGACVALRGPGGIGKTRLAAALGAAWAGRPAPAGGAGAEVVWWSLAEATSAIEAWAGLAAALGLDDSRPAALAAALGARAALLVADNAEPLLDDPGFLAALDRLRAAVPALRVLLTSRRTVAGAREFVLDGLDVPDPADPPGAVLRAGAVRLFVARAQALDPAFDARAHAAALGRIARLADGHALALELAAGRVRHASPDEIAAALQAGSADLDGVFEASWQALPPALQPALAGLAALPPSFDRMLAEAATGLRPSGFDALAARSLVDRAAGSARWRLHPLLRLWLQARHPAPQAEAAAAEAVVKALDARVAAQGAGHAEVLAWMGEELPLLRLAFERAAAQADATLLARLAPVLGEWFELRGRRTEGLAVFAQAAQRLEGVPAATRAPVQVARARLCYRAGRFDEALLLAAGVGRASRRVRAEAHGVRGLVAWQRGAIAAARRHHRATLRIAVEDGLDDVVPQALCNLASCDMHEGRLDAALAGFEQVARLAEARGALRLRVLALMNAGCGLQGAGRGEQACAPLEQALALVRAGGLVSLEPAVLSNLAAARLDMRDFAAVRALLPALRRCVGPAEPAYAIAVELLELLLHARGGTPEAGWPFARAAWRAAAQAGAASRQAAVVLRCAELWAAQGDREQAAAWLAWYRARTDQWADDQREADALWAQLQLDETQALRARRQAEGLSLSMMAALLAGSQPSDSGTARAAP